MKNKVLILMFFGFIVSCTNNYDTNDSFEINGKYTHQITGCDNAGNPEINCVDYIEFINKSTVNILIGGGDIVFRTNYKLNNNQIELEKMGGLDFDVTFKIKNRTSLTRIEDNSIWGKTE